MDWFLYSAFLLYPSTRNAFYSMSNSPIHTHIYTCTSSKCFFSDIHNSCIESSSRMTCSTSWATAALCVFKALVWLCSLSCHTSLSVSWNVSFGFLDLVTLHLVLFNFSLHLSWTSSAKSAAGLLFHRVYIWSLRFGLSFYTFHYMT